MAAITASADEINYNDITTLGTAEASKTMTWDSNSAWTASGGTCANLGTVSTVDLNGGTIDGATIATSDVTVGTGKTLDVSAGTITTSPAQDLTAMKRGVTGNDADQDFGAFEVRAQTLQSDIEDGTSPMTITSTTMVANLNVESLSGMKVIDEDGMDSDSATRLPTQQSVKAYVDSQLGASDLDILVDGASATGIDLATQTIDYKGTSNEIELALDATGDARSLTFGLPDSVTIGSDLTVGGNIEGSSDNMLIHSGDAADYSFGESETKILTLQGDSGIRMVNNVEVTGDITPTGSRSIGSDSERWVSTHSQSVEMDHAKHSSFNVALTDTSATKVVSFVHASYKSAKISINVSNGTDYTAREVIVVCKEDGSGAKVVEYGVLGTHASDVQGVLTVATNGADVELKVTGTSGMACTGSITSVE